MGSGPRHPCHLEECVDGEQQDMKGLYGSGETNMDREIPVRGSLGKTLRVMNLWLDWPFSGGGVGD